MKKISIYTLCTVEYNDHNGSHDLRRGHVPYFSCHIHSHSHSHSPFAMIVFQLFYEMKLKNSISLKSCHFEGSKDIMTKYKSQTLLIIRIKYWKGEWQSSLPHSRPLENCHFRSKNEILRSFLHMPVQNLMKCQRAGFASLWFTW